LLLTFSSIIKITKDLEKNIELDDIDERNIKYLCKLGKELALSKTDELDAIVEDLIWLKPGVVIRNSNV